MLAISLDNVDWLDCRLIVQVGLMYIIIEMVRISTAFIVSLASTPSLLSIILS